MLPGPPLRNRVLQGSWACFLSQSRQRCSVFQLLRETTPKQLFCGSQLFSSTFAAWAGYPRPSPHHHNSSYRWSLTSPAACNQQRFCHSLSSLPAHQPSASDGVLRERSGRQVFGFRKFGCSRRRREKIGPDNTLNYHPF